MAKSIATVSGVALAPGVSRNGRRYTREAIAKAVSRAQQRIADGSLPMTMLTHHAAEDDSTKIVGRVTSMALGEHGEALFSADIAGTPDGEKIAQLLDTSDGKPAFLRNVSIRGSWLGKVRRENSPGGPVETADDLELDGLDYTRKPGVDAASVTAFAWAKDGATETHERVPITESVQEAHVAVTEDAPAVPDGVREVLRAVLGEPVTEAGTPSLSKRGSGLSDEGGRQYADPGYQADKKQRYDLTTKAKAKAAWSYINQADNAKAYTANQLKRVKGRIRAALKKFGVQVAAEGWCIEPAQLITEQVAEFYGGDPECAGSYSLSATNGPTTVTVCSYGLDPADLQVILAQACKGAGLALQSLDPDMDADIDVPGAEAEDTDDDADQLAARLAAAFRGESAEDPDAVLAEARASAAVSETAPREPAPEPDAERQQETEAPVTETTTTEAAGQVTAAATLTQADVDAAVAKALADRKAAKRAKKAAQAAESAPAAPVAETDDDRIARLVAEQVAARLAESAPAQVQETEEQRIARLVEEKLVSERQRLAEAGMGPGRKGLAPSGAVSEHTAAKTSGEPGLNGHGLPSDWPDKPLHAFSTDELDTYVGPAVTRHYLGSRADLIA